MKLEFEIQIYSDNNIEFDPTIVTPKTNSIGRILVCSSESEQFRYTVGLRNHKGFRFLPILHLTEKEKGIVSHFVLKPKKLIFASTSDFEKNRNRLVWHELENEKTFTTLSDFRLSKCKIPERTICSDDAFEEYVCDEELAKEIDKHKYSGIKLERILDNNSIPLHNAFRLCVKNYLPQRIKDQTYHTQCIAFSEDVLPNTPDFIRMSEPLCANDMSPIIVRNKIGLFRVSQRPKLIFG
jgi:hypothetical protein